MSGRKARRNGEQSKQVVRKFCVTSAPGATRPETAWLRRETCRWPESGRGALVNLVRAKGRLPLGEADPLGVPRRAKGQLPLGEADPLGVPQRVAVTSRFVGSLLGYTNRTSCTCRRSFP